MILTGPWKLLNGLIKKNNPSLRLIFCANPVVDLRTVTSLPFLPRLILSISYSATMTLL